MMGRTCRKLWNAFRTPLLHSRAKPHSPQAGSFSVRGVHFPQQLSKRVSAVPSACLPHARDAHIPYLLSADRQSTNLRNKPIWRLSKPPTHSVPAPASASSASAPDLASKSVPSSLPHSFRALERRSIFSQDWQRHESLPPFTNCHGAFSRNTFGYLRAKGQSGGT
jgi:hypothetical protein